MESKRYWLFKSEPVTYGIDYLRRDTETPWTGVRNFQARNFMREMKVGDEGLFYHSSCKDRGVYGMVNVVSAPYADPSQFEKKGEYYDPRATLEKPIWDLVDIAFVKKLDTPLLLSAIRANRKLEGMKILQPGGRLSVTPVTKLEFEEITKG